MPVRRIVEWFETLVDPTVPVDWETILQGVSPDGDGTPGLWPASSLSGHSCYKLRPYPHPHPPITPEPNARSALPTSTATVSARS